MAESIATRAAFGKALAQLGDKYPQIVVLDADLSGSTMTKTFADKYPDRFFNIGIAEGNMMNIAAGLASCGKKVFASSFAIFAAGRAWEQVRNGIAYPHLNVTVVGSHGGVSVGEDGATHQPTEDLACMRAIPGMLVLCPCDGNEMRCAVEALLEYDGPAYLRLGRLAVETVTTDIPDYSFTIGKGVTLRDGKDVTIIAVGLMVQESLKAAKLLEEEGVSVRVIDMHTIKPLDGDIIRKAAQETGLIITAEEHNVLGGLGGAVAEYTAQNCPVRVVRHGMQDTFGRSGEAKQVLAHFELTAEGIAKTVRAALAEK